MSAQLLRARRETEAMRARIAKGEKPEMPGNFRIPGAGPWDFSQPTAIGYAKVPGDSATPSGWYGTKEPFSRLYLTQFVATGPRTASRDVWDAIAKKSENCDGWMPATRKVLETVFEHGFVLAGGAVCSFVAQRNLDNIADFDIFAPGMEPEEAERRFFEMMEDIAKERFGTEKETAIYRTLNCITALVLDLNANDHRDAFEIQLITREYGSIAEVIYGFDIAPCAVAWDGKEIYMTQAALLAHKTGVFELDLTKRRRSFEDRVSKYVHKKGFGVVMPKLDMAAVQLAFDERKKVKMPFLEINVCSVVGKCITAHAVTRPDIDDRELTKDREKARQVYGALPYFSRGELVTHNVRRILYGDKYLVWGHAGDGRRPHSWEMVIDSEGQTAATLCNLVVTNRDPLPLIEKICEQEATAMGHAVMWLTRNRDKWRSSTGRALTLCEEIDLLEYFDKSDPFLRHILRVAKNIVDKAQDLRRTEFTWKVAEEGTDLDKANDPPPKSPTGDEDERIFKMERITAAEWYGDFYRTA